jgi:hypothetical protein
MGTYGKTWENMGKHGNNGLRLLKWQNMGFWYGLYVLWTGISATKMVVFDGYILWNMSGICGRFMELIDTLLCNQRWLKLEHSHE